MGEPRPGGEKTVYVGESTGRPATVDEALKGLAEQIVNESRFVTGGEEGTGPKWFDITFMQVEIENQNVKTFSIGATPRS
ncbi:MAG: hypothetical protein K0S64_55 [Gaiellaceae bacterium]|jgi:hypothetical protein|nr:hypothetical protein [Gaiellaceae bacterium]